MRRPEPHILLFRRPLGTDPTTGLVHGKRIDPATGKVDCIMDAGYLTAVRTGAASGVATKYLAREDASVCTLFGAGGQARQQLEAVHRVRPLSKICLLYTSDAADDLWWGAMGGGRGLL